MQSWPWNLHVCTQYESVVVYIIYTAINIIYASIHDCLASYIFNLIAIYYAQLFYILVYASTLGWY